MIPEPQQIEYGLPQFLRSYAAVLWKEWPMDLEVVAKPMVTVAIPGADGLTSDFNLRGTCPHCRKPVGFLHVGPFSYSEPVQAQKGITLQYSVMQCQGCLKCILSIVRVCTPERGDHNRVHRSFEYVEHYPVGTPDDSVAKEVPEHIAADFREALRCRWVDGYNATVEMCRRSIEASCLGLGAKPKLSITQKIDWVYKQGRINKTLKNVAHKIRLGGNRGSHPIVDLNAESPLTADEADAVIAFTRHYLDHVYVVEARLGKI